MKMRAWWRLPARLCAVMVLATGSSSIAELSPDPGRAAARPVKNVILFIGDGLGITTVTAARILRGQLEGAVPPESAQLATDTFPAAAFLHTYSADAQVTDSAAAMTAMMCGEKTANGHLAVSAGNDSVPGRSLPTFLELAEATGRATGVVTTTRVTHATPAACFAHVDDRGSEHEIAAALLENPALGDGIEVVLGGGWRHFLPELDPAGAAFRGPEGQPGSRPDGRDLVAELAARGMAVAYDSAGLAAIDPASTPRLLGLFAASHMAYELDRPQVRSQEPALADMAVKAVEILSRDPDGFFLMVEGGRIDHALHATQARRALHETLAFDAALRAVIERVDIDSTLILVTGDHDHTLTIASGGPLGSDILGLADDTDADGVPYTTLLFGTGPGRRDSSRTAPSAAEIADPDYRYESAIRTGSGQHGATDLPLYGLGPEAHLGAVRGSRDNTAVFSIMCRAAGIAQPGGL